MPTFAVAFDRLLETRASTSVDKTVSSPMPVPNSRPPQTKPISTSKLERRNSTPSGERKIPQMTPSLYAIPNPTPIPDSPSSFSPSPYVVNHKRRGPRLGSSSTVPDVSSLEKTTAEPKGNGIGNDGENSIATVDIAVRDTNGRMVEDKDVHCASVGLRSTKSKNIGLGSESSTSLEGYLGKAEFPKPNQLICERPGDNKDFVELQESLSYTSNTEGEDNGITDCFSRHPSAGEFFDAWEELSSESDHQPSFRDIEKELREIRLSLLMEIEKRKQAEEALTSMQGQWQRLRQELSAIGITLPAHPYSESEELSGNPVDDVCQQVALARFVSEAIGRGTAKAEMETKIEEQIEAKNFEITRLIDRLHYYEAMNQEMSQRNQESVERSRRLRQVRQRRQKWIWRSVAAAFTLGSASLLWSYYSTGKGESSSYSHEQLKQHLSGPEE